MASKNVKSGKNVVAVAADKAVDKFAYAAPALPQTVKDFTVHFDAFAGVESIVAARKVAAVEANGGERDGANDQTRAGFNRELWIDAIDGAIVVRSKDHTVLGGRTNNPEKAAMVYNDATGAARPIEVARFPKTKLDDAAKVAAELVAFYKGGDADNRLNPLANRFALVKDARTLSIIALLSSHFDSPQVVGHFANRQAKSAKRSTKSATKGIADARSLLAESQDAELKAALAKVEAALAAKSAAK